MKKSKTPVLTSPWKIGFLVSLLLVLGSIGVNYVLSRTFHLSWQWLSFQDGRWVFNMDRFSIEMLPQIAVIVLLCFVAYFSVTSAVRKYKAYLDSGLEYKHLLQSIKSVEDIEDDEKLKRLDKYPELKELVRSIKERFVAEGEKFKVLESELEQLRTMGGDASDLQAECSRLAGAIRTSVAAGIELEGCSDLKHPACREIAAAVSEIPTRGDHSWSEEDRAKLEDLYRELKESGDYLKGRLAEISRELLQNGEGAKEIEEQLSALKGKVQRQEGDDGQRWDIEVLENMVGNLKTMEKLADSLGDLGEEAKSIAINTALQAGSGESTLADLIQLAEGVKEVADKFDSSAESFKTLAEGFGRDVGILKDQAGKLSASIGSEVSSGINMLASKVSLWVERVVVLSDKVKTLEKAYNLSFKTLENKIGNYVASKEVEEIQLEVSDPSGESHSKASGAEIPEMAFERQEYNSHLFSEPEESEEPAPARSEDEEAFVDLDAGSEPASPEGDVKAAEQEETTAGGTEEISEEQFFADLVGSKDSLERESPGVSGQPSQDEVQPSREETAEKKVESEDVQDFTAMDIDEVKPEKVVIPAEKIEKDEEIELDEGTEQEEVIDLYALGAVDYVAEHSEQSP